MAFFPVSKHQKQEMARILRQPLAPEVAERLRTQTERQRDEQMRAEAQAELERATVTAAAEEAYRKALPERLRAERQERFLKNAEKYQ